MPTSSIDTESSHAAAPPTAPSELVFSPGFKPQEPSSRRRPGRKASTKPTRGFPKAPAAPPIPKAALAAPAQPPAAPAAAPTNPSNPSQCDDDKSNSSNDDYGCPRPAKRRRQGSWQPAVQEGPQEAAAETARTAVESDSCPGRQLFPSLPMDKNEACPNFIATQQPGNQTSGACCLTPAPAPPSTVAAPPQQQQQRQPPPTTSQPQRPAGGPWLGPDEPFTKHHPYAESGPCPCAAPVGGGGRMGVSTKINKGRTTSCKKGGRKPITAQTSLAAPTPASSVPSWDPQQRPSRSTTAAPSAPASSASSSSAGPFPRAAADLVAAAVALASSTTAAWFPNLRATFTHEVVVHKVSGDTPRKVSWVTSTLFPRRMAAKRNGPLPVRLELLQRAMACGGPESAAPTAARGALASATHLYRELDGAATAVRAVVDSAVLQGRVVAAGGCEGRGRGRDALHAAESILAPPKYYDVEQVPPPAGQVPEEGVAWFEVLMLSEWGERGTLADQLKELEGRAKAEGRVDWPAEWAELLSSTAQLEVFAMAYLIWCDYKPQNVLSVGGGAAACALAIDLDGMQRLSARQRQEADSAAWWEAAWAVAARLLLPATESVAAAAAAAEKAELAAAQARHLALQPCKCAWFTPCYAAPEHVMQWLEELQRLHSSKEAEAVKRQQIEKFVAGCPGLVQLSQMVEQGRATEEAVPGLFAVKDAQGRPQSYSCMLSQVYAWGETVEEHVVGLEAALGKSGVAPDEGDLSRLALLRALAATCRAALPEDRPTAGEVMASLRDLAGADGVGAQEGQGQGQGQGGQAGQEGQEEEQEGQEEEEQEPSAGSGPQSGPGSGWVSGPAQEPEVDARAGQRAASCTTSSTACSSYPRSGTPEEGPEEEEDWAWQHATSYATISTTHSSSRSGQGFGQAQCRTLGSGQGAGSWAVGGSMEVDGEVEMEVEEDAHLQQLPDELGHMEVDMGPGVHEAPGCPLLPQSPQPPPLQLQPQWQQQEVGQPMGDWWRHGREQGVWCLQQGLQQLPGAVQQQHQGEDAHSAASHGMPYHGMSTYGMPPYGMPYHAMPAYWGPEGAAGPCAMQAEGAGAALLQLQLEVEVEVLL